MISRWRWVGLLMLAVTTTPLGAAEAPWRVAHTPRFTVYSQLRDEPTRRWIRQFDQFITSLGGVFRLDERRLPPLTVVLMKSDKDFGAYKPRRPDGKVEDKVAGFFARSDGWGVIGMAEGWDDTMTRRIILHEGVHWFLSAYPTRNPVWMEEGLAEVFSTFEVVEEKGKSLVQWGQPIDHHVNVLCDGGEPPLPYRTLISLKSGDALFNESHRVGLVYAQSWALVHCMIFGKQEGSRSLFNLYQAARREGLDPEPALQKAFGADFKGIDTKLKHYAFSGEFHYFRKPHAGSSAAKLELTPVAGTEVEVALARLAMGSGRHEQAAKHVERALAREPESADVWGTAALLAATKGENARILETANRAAELGSIDPLLRILRAGAEINLLAEQGEVSGKDARRLADEIERAINQRPVMRFGYRLLAMLARVLPEVRPTDLDFLKLGRRIFPDEPLFALGLADMAAKRGEREAAAGYLQEALADRAQLSPGDRTYAEHLADRWVMGDLRDRMNAHQEAGRFTEAVTAADELLAQRLDPVERSTLIRHRRELATRLELAAARAAREEGRAEEARALFEALKSQSSLSAIIRREIERELVKLQ